MWKIALASTPEQIGRCSSVRRELRPPIAAIYLKRGVDITSRHFQMKLNP